VKLSPHVPFYRTNGAKVSKTFSEASHRPSRPPVATIRVALAGARLAGKRHAGVEAVQLLNTLFGYQFVQRHGGILPL
jgi:hypothetical protein